MSTPLVSLLLPCAAAVLLGGIASAQHRSADAPGPAGFAMDRVHGIVHGDDGAPWAIGRDYKARFANGAIEFTPALGSRAPRNLPLAFRLLSIARGSEPVHTVTAAPAAAVAGQVVTFARGSVAERYECRPEGVEQNFVFAERPAGTGDVVVRGAITTALQPSDRGDGTLFFRHGDVGGVTIGAVTGVDARGALAAGSLTFADGVLELRLPGAFVDAAAYPMVLDPLLGTGFVAGDTFADEDQVDVAFEEGLNVWLVVWRRTYSLLDQDILAQRVTATGAFFGTAVAITLTATTCEGRPSVAAVNSRNRFVVAWESSPTGFGSFTIRAVSVSTASMGATVDVSVFGESSTCPAVCGDRSTSGTKALIAWGTPIGPTKQRTADVSATGVITLGTVHAASGGGTAVRLPRSRTPTGITVLARGTTQLAGLLNAEVLDYDGVTLGITIPQMIVSPFPAGEGTYAIDGDGSKFLLAYLPLVTGPASGPGECIAITWNGTTLTAGAPVQFTPAVPGSMAVAWLGERFLLAWEEPTANPFDSELKALAMKPDCAACSVELTVPVVTRPNQRAPAIGACFAGGSAQPRALVTWSETNTTAPFRSLVHAQRFEAMTGVPATALSATCAGGGSAGSEQPFALGSEDFTFTLAGGDPTAPIALLGLADGSTTAIPCGCSFVNPLVTYAMPAIAGGARFVFPLPCNPLLLGVTIEYQWLLFGGTASPCPLVPGLTGSERVLLTLSL